MHVTSGPQNKQVAWSDLDALVARYKFTREQLHQERAEWKDQTPFSDVLRSAIHERTHFIQATSTTWGIFCWRLRDVQTGIIKDIIKMLRSQDIPVRPPIRLQLQELGANPGQLIRSHALLWLAIEAFLVREDGTWQDSASLSEEATRAGLVGRVETFAAMQAAIARTYEANMLAARRSGSSGASLQAGTIPDADALSAEQAPDDAHFGKQELMTHTMKMFVNESATSVSILESSALAGEICYATNTEVNRILGMDIDADRFPYLEPLILTARVLGPLAPPDLLYSHIVCCDLALMPPILPNLWRVRHGLNLMELMPRYRFFEIISALKRVAPGGAPRDLDGYLETVNAIFDLLGWVSPTKIVSLWNSGSRPPIQIDVRDHVFDQAIKARQVCPPLFCLPQLSVAGPEPLIRMAMKFEFPIIQWSDCVTYTRDKSMLSGFLWDYSWYRWLRQLYLGNDRPLTVPWQADQEQLDELSDQVQGLMVAALNWEQAPRPRFRSLNSTY